MIDARPVVAGNWKMNHGPSAARTFFDEFDAVDDAVRVVVFPPAVTLPAAVDAARGSGVEIGVQNVHTEDSGAFTGETSAGMASEAGATLALIGHSERRHLFGETDEQVAAKIRRVAAEGLEPVVCVGETLDERRAGRLEAVLDRQIRAALATLPTDGRFMIAYEPVWAIGTGETATPGDAAEAHALLRARLHEVRGDVAGGVPILYGGSVKPANAAELLAAEGVDGVLVGGASLSASDFRQIVEAI